MQMTSQLTCPPAMDMPMRIMSMEMLGEMAMHRCRMVEMGLEAHTLQGYACLLVVYMYVYMYDIHYKHIYVMYVFTYKYKSILVYTYPCVYVYIHAYPYTFLQGNEPQPARRRDSIDSQVSTAQSEQAQSLQRAGSKGLGSRRPSKASSSRRRALGGGSSKTRSKYASSQNVALEQAQLCCQIVCKGAYHGASVLEVIAYCAFGTAGLLPMLWQFTYNCPIFIAWTMFPAFDKLSC